MLPHIVVFIMQRPMVGDAPDEFQGLIGNRLLFKVQVADMNIRLGWQSFTVKKFTAEGSIIQRFLNLHKLEVNINYLYFSFY